MLSSVMKHGRRNTREVKVHELGIRGFIKYLKLACEGSMLDKNRIKEARERKFMWKLKLNEV